MKPDDLIAFIGILAITLAMLGATAALFPEQTKWLVNRVSGRGKWTR